MHTFVFKINSNIEVVQQFNSHYYTKAKAESCAYCYAKKQGYTYSYNYVNRAY